MKTKLTLFGIIFLCLLSCKEKDDIPPSNVVFIQRNSFSPATINITAGTTITWVNKESTIHTVTSNDASLFDSNDLKEGENYISTFMFPGTYAYHCKNHPDMQGVVIVK
ncbi:MAG TPA: cupredoxin domain-containing protein [Chitinophagales bacterium]|nr:cupredoxin domain-containing protein [Chitinophagales bacterium]